MKKITICLILLNSIFVIASNSQNTYSNKSFELFKEVVYKQTEFEKIEIFEVDKISIDYLLSNSKKEFKMIYTFGYWCGPCVVHLPILLEYISNTDNIDLFILVSERNDSRNLYLTKEYFKNKTDYIGPVFNVSDSYSSNKRRKYRIFTSLLVPNHTEYGYSLHILYNENNDVIYASTYNESDEEKIKKIIQHTTK